MPNRNYQRGRAFEYKVKKYYESLGWFVVRAAGSKGPFDLITIRGKHADEEYSSLAAAIQCKTRVPTVAERKKLAHAARQVGIWAFFAFLVPGRSYRGCKRPFETLAPRDASTIS